MSKSDSSDLPIIVFCQACGAKHSFALSTVGKKARCLTCSHVFTVPALNKPHTDNASKKAQKRSAAKPSFARSKNAGAESPAPVEHGPHKESMASMGSSDGSFAGSVLDDSQSPEHIIAEPTTSTFTEGNAALIMLGLLYVALLATVIFLLSKFLGIPLAIWILLPPIVVYGRQTAIKIVFLLAGKAVRPQQ